MLRRLAPVLLALSLVAATAGCALPSPAPLPPTVTPAPPSVTPLPTGKPTAASTGQASGLIRGEDLAYIVDHLAKGLRDPVTIWLFTVAPEGDTLVNFRAILREVTRLDSRLHFEDREYVRDVSLATSFGLDKGPAVVVSSGVSQVPSGAESGQRVLRFFGIPEALQFAVLLQDIVLVSGKPTELKPETIEALTKISKPVKIEIFFNAT